MTKRRPLVAGNWKMNGLRSDARALAGNLAQMIETDTEYAFDMVICPPFTVLETVKKAIEQTSIMLGAQPLLSQMGLKERITHLKMESSSVLPSPVRLNQQSGRALPLMRPWQARL